MDSDSGSASHFANNMKDQSCSPTP